MTKRTDLLIEKNLIILKDYYLRDEKAVVCYMVNNNDDTFMLHDGKEFAWELQKRGLANYDGGELLSLTDEGYEIAIKGGWLKHLELMKAQEEKDQKDNDFKNSIQERLQITQVELNELSIEHSKVQKKLSSFQYKYSTPIFLSSAFAIIISICSIFYVNIQKDKQIEKLQYKIKKLQITSNFFTQNILIPQKKKVVHKSKQLRTV